MLKSFIQFRSKNREFDPGSGRIVAGAAFALIAAVYWSGAAAETGSVPETRAEIQYSYAPLVKRTAPGVVNIYTRKIVRQQVSPLLDDPVFRRFFGEGLPGATRERVQNSLGSGVIVDSDGIIVTNNHVIEGAEQITVALADRREFEAEVVSRDERTDLAVLKIDAKGEKLPYLVFGDSDELEVGDLVLAIGDPFGVGQTVTSGIVSALARTQIGMGDVRSFIQTDAAINPGNSGGPLINMKGELVGINTAIFSRSGGSHGVGFAIPANMAKTVVHAALAGQPIAHPWLGVSGETVTAETAKALGLARPEGVLIKAIHALSPAGPAGLQAGDIVTAVNEHPTDDAESLKFRIATFAVGDSVTLDVLRGTGMLAVKVALIAPPEKPKREATKISGDNPLTGATVANLSPALASEMGLDDMLTGVVLTQVPAKSTAASLQFEAGEVLLKINETPVDSVAGLLRIIDQANPVWHISLNRGGRVLDLTVRR